MQRAVERVGASGAEAVPSSGRAVNKWLVLAVVGVGGFMASLNSASLIIILPTLQQAFHTQLINIFWVLLSYTLASAILLLTVGRMADLWGNKRIYLVGYAIFGVGSVLSALSGTVEVLIAARFIQGIGGALLTANSSAIITHTFPKGELGRALGISSMVYAVGTTLGPIVGGLLTDAIDWHWAFWVNVPIAVIGFFLAYAYLSGAGGTRASSRADAQREGLDLLGAALLAVSFATLLVFVSLGPMYGWGSPGMLFDAAIFVVATALFFWRQLVVTHPLLDLRLFGNRLFAMANISASFATMGMIAVLFLLPFYLEDVLHYSLFMSAVLLTPYPVAVLIVSPLSGYLSDRFGSRFLGTLGMLLAALSLWSLSTLSLHETYAPIALRLVLLGIGMGLFQSPNNSAVMTSAPADRRGVASAVLGTMRNLGQMLGIGIIGAVFVSFMPFNAFLQLALTGETTATGALAVVAAFRVCYLVATGFALAGALASLGRGAHVAPPAISQGQRAPTQITDAPASTSLAR